MRQSNMIEENESKPTTTDPNDEIRTDVKLSDPEYVVQAEKAEKAEKAENNQNS